MVNTKREQLPTSVGSLQLELHESSVLAGGPLRGTVTLRIAQPAEATVISVKIEALERMHWSGSGQYDSVRTQQVTFTHVDTEFTLGNLNGDLAVGVHCLPFEFILPPDLVADSLVKGLLRKAVGDKRRVLIKTHYSVSAKLEVAGLTNSGLQQKCVFEVLVPPLATPLGSPVALTHSDNVRPLMGLGSGNACVVHIQLASNVVLFPSGTIEADVTIELPTKPKLHRVHIVLYEDVFFHNQYQGSAREDSRRICRQKYSTKHFRYTVSGSSKTLAGRVQLTVSDPDAEAYGDLTPSLSTRYLQIRHRVGIECSFVLGSRVTMSVPVMLIKSVARPG